MNNSIYNLSIPSLIVAMLPLVLVGIIYIKWCLDLKKLIYITARMLTQLVLIGFFLVFIFNLGNPFAVAGVLTFMLLVASWIAVRPAKETRKKFFFSALISVAVSGVSILGLIIGGVIDLEPWHHARYVIPLAGMTFAQAMNSISLTLDRYIGETEKNVIFEKAKKVAFKTAVLPISNSFLAVGLVSLPGMMTGQILAGVSPLIAVRYQIMIMSMLFGAAGIASFLFLTLIKKQR